MSIKNTSHAVTAELVAPAGGANGVITAQGGSVGGWSLYAKEGALRYCYNYFGLNLTVVTANQPIPTGTHQVRMEFAYDRDGAGKGGDVTRYDDGNVVGNGRVEATIPNVFSADGTCDVGREYGSPVSTDYGPHATAFRGEVQWVQIDLEGEDQDHLVSPEEPFQVAMARQ